MPSDHLSYARLLKAAALGAVIGLLFDLAVTLATAPSRAFSIAQVPSSAAFLLVGFAGGWLFELFKAQTEVTDRSLQSITDMQKSVDRLTRKITYQDRALTMLIDAPRHKRGAERADQGVHQRQLQKHSGCRCGRVSAPPQLGDQSFRQLRRRTSEIPSAGTRTLTPATTLTPSVRKR